MPPATESTDVADALRQTYEKSMSKKKKKNNADLELLENLKKGDNLRKEDKLAEANLMKDKNERIDVGKSNRGYEDDEKIIKKKKNTSPRGSNEKETANSDDREMASNENPIEEKPKRKKKKKRLPDVEMDAKTAESGDTADIAETKIDEEAPLVDRTSEDNIDANQSADPDNVKSPTKKKTKKKKKKKPGGYTELKNDGSSTKTDSDAVDGSTPVPRIDTNFEEDTRILGITIHRTDRLKQDKYITKPAVRVHVMDINEQNYVKKEDKKRELQLPHPPGYESLETYPPVATSDFDYKKRQSLIPRWEEQLFVDERYLYFIENETEKGSPDTIIFFEIVNQLAENTSRGQKGRSNWMRVAWAFLKLVGGNRSLNVEKKVRLQLFYPMKQFTNSNEPNGDVLDGVELMDWFVGQRKINYPATLYVTVKGTHVSAANLPRKTFGRMSEADSEGFDDTGDESTKKEVEEEPTWSRMPGQICKVPNKMFKSLKAGKGGCSVLRFSTSGRKLACACGDKLGGYVILVYEIPSGKFLGQLPGHFNIIYDIAWAKTDFEIITCSQDGSVLSWDVERMRKTPLKTFTHPSYVYCAKYHPMASHIIVSGCYDNVIRVWSSLSSGKEGTLLRELQAHNGFVNCLCFNAPGNTMYSCDSVGTVITWKVDLAPQTMAGTLDSTDTVAITNASEWIQERIFTDPEISDVPISVVQLHGSGRRLLLQCRDNTTRVLDLRLNIIMARYTGAINFKDHIRSTFTPCGTYIFSSSEDFTAVVWNTDTSETVCTYRDLGFTSSISDICFHPFEHMVAFCAIGQSQPIVIYSYDYMVPDKHVVDGDENAMTDNELAAMHIPSATTTPRIQSFRSKSPLLSSAAFHGLGPTLDPMGSHRASSGKPDLLMKSTRELASEIIQSVRLEQVNRKLNTSNIQDPQSSFRGSRRSRSRDRRLVDGGETDGDLSARSIPRSEISDSSFALTAGVSRGFIRPGELVRQVDSEMPGTRMTMFIQGEQPKFLVSAKTGVSEWARVEVDYTAQRSDELSLTKGALVKIVLKDNDMWWLGEVGRKQGYVPSKCLQVISESDAQAMALHEKEVANQTTTENSNVTNSKGPDDSSVAPSTTDDTHTAKPRSKSALSEETTSEAPENEATSSGSSMSATSRAKRRLKKNVTKSSGSNGSSPAESDNNSAEEAPVPIAASTSKPLQTIQDIEEEQIL